MAYNLPEIHQATLPGGMKLLGVEYDRAPWLSLTFMAKRGAETDPLDKPGVADWAAELLTLGTARRTQLQLAEDIESRGGGAQRPERLGRHPGEPGRAERGFCGVDGHHGRSGPDPRVR